MLVYANIYNKIFIGGEGGGGGHRFRHMHKTEKVQKFTPRKFLLEVILAKGQKFEPAKISRYIYGKFNLGIGGLQI